MLSEADYQEAVRRYKDMKVNGHERQRYHALILVHQGYSYREVGQILLVDEDTIGRWVQQYQERGLGGLKNDGQGGGEHGQRELGPKEVEELKRLLREEAMPGTKVGSGWTNKAVRQLIAERFGVTYSKSGVRKLFAYMGWSYQRGRKLYIRRDPVDQARYEWETRTVLARYARNGRSVVPLASDQSKVYLEGTLGRRWNPIGQQPLVEDGARQKRAENLYGAVHLGTGAEVAPFAIDWQDSEATIRWYELLLEECPQGQILLWQDQAPHHTSEEVEEWLEAQPRIEVIAFPKYTPEENPKEATWKDLKAEVSHHRWHETMADLRTAIDSYYQAGKKHVVNFLQKFGYRWVDGILQPLPQTV
jgi:transposase